MTDTWIRPCGNCCGVIETNDKDMPDHEFCTCDNRKEFEIL